MMAQVPPQLCPFCGVAADGPHETQEGCIAALHAEIARMRELLDHVRPTGGRIVHDDEPDEPDA